MLVYLNKQRLPKELFIIQIKPWNLDQGKSTLKFLFCVLHMFINYHLNVSKHFVCLQ